MSHSPESPPPAPPDRRRTPGVVVFAHVPPPHHGQSYAVQLLVERLKAPHPEPGRELRLFHVDARLSDDIEAIGRFQPRKVLRLLRYCFQAIGHRLRNRVRVLYYIPAAPMRSAVFRDWLVLALCRPVFSHIVFHWEAAGLGEWLATSAKPWERAITHFLLDRHSLSVVLAEHGRADANALRARNVVVVPNGIPDPCADFDIRLAPIRAARRLDFAARARGEKPGGTPALFRALFLSLCIPEKGLFDAIKAVALANAECERRSVPVRIQLTVAGKFWKHEDRVRFGARCDEADLQIHGALPADPAATLPAVLYRGFVTNEEKSALFEASDVFLFPSYYPAESFGLALAEAMAFGLPIIATRWRHIPEMFPDGYPFLVNPQSPGQIAEALIRLLDCAPSESLRPRFLERFTDRAYAEGIRNALLSLDGQDGIDGPRGRRDTRKGTHGAGLK